MALVSVKNNANFIGRLCQVPELMTTANGKEIVNFSLAVDKGWGENKRTIFIRMVAFGMQAKYISKLSQGSEVSINCEYDIRDYTTSEGDKRQSHEFSVNDVISHGRKETGEQAKSNQTFTTDNLPKFEEISSNGDLPF